MIESVLMFNTFIVTMLQVSSGSVVTSKLKLNGLRRLKMFQIENISDLLKIISELTITRV